MGTRLYPMTKDTAILEKLAGVPQGTNDKLQKIYSYYDERAKELYNVYTTLQLTLDRTIGLGPIGEALRASIQNEMNSCRKKISRLEEDKFVEIDKDVQLAILDHFILNGWGKFNLNLVPGNEDDKYCGETHNAELAYQLLLSSTSFTGLNGVDIQELANAGLCWN